MKAARRSNAPAPGRNEGREASSKADQVFDAAPQVALDAEVGDELHLIGDLVSGTDLLLARGRVGIADVEVEAVGQGGLRLGVDAGVLGLKGAAVEVLEDEQRRLARERLPLPASSSVVAPVASRETICSWASGGSLVKVIFGSLARPVMKRVTR